MAAGDFTASHLPDILVAKDQVFTGERHKRGIIKDVSTANAILGRQMVNWEPFYEGAGLNSGRSCIGAKAVWLKACDDTVSDCGQLSDCNLTGPELESDSQLYQPNLCFEKSGSVLDNQCKDLFDKATKIGVQMANIMASLEQELQSRLITFAFANVQDNRYAGTYGVRKTVAVDSESTTIFPESQWTSDIIAELIATAENNDFYNYYLLSGKNLWTQAFISQYREGCCNTDKLVTGDGPVDIFFDLKNIDLANGGVKSTLMIDAGAFGYFNVTDYANESPQPFSQGSDLSVWRVPSSRLSYMNGDKLEPVYFDFEIQEVCTVDNSRNKKYVKTVVLGRHQGGIALAPPTCNEDDTGILLFEVEHEDSGEGEGEA